MNRSLISVGYELHETRGKTTNSRRWIDLDDVTMVVLARWRDALAGELGREVSDDDYVFCTSTGGPVHPDRLTQIFGRLVAYCAGPPPTAARPSSHARDACCSRLAFRSR